MKCLLGLACILALTASPLALSAQAQEEATSAEPSVDVEPKRCSECSDCQSEWILSLFERGYR